MMVVVMEAGVLAAAVVVAMVMVGMMSDKFSRSAAFVGLHTFYLLFFIFSLICTSLETVAGFFSGRTRWRGHFMASTTGWVRSRCS